MTIPSMSAQEFYDKWRNVELKERSGSQEHFIDLCRLVGHPTPAEAHRARMEMEFEAGATKARGGQGWADVWKRGCFAWEYKGKHKDLDAAYQQLLQHHESLDHPPLLVVSDMDQIIVYTKFTNAPRADDPRVQAIAGAARELVDKRDAWLNPQGATEKELKRRTLTNLYNEYPTWLGLAHRKLDEAVLDAYGWPHDLSDEEILERLLALNLERAGD